MKQKEWRYKNTAVSPPLLIVGLSTTSTTKWSTNVVYDWGDESEAYYDEDLSPIEKGHLYLWREGKNSLVQVNMPYRIMDKETGSFVEGLRSFKSLKCLSRRATEATLRIPSLCVSDFQLSHDDFLKFKERVLVYGGEVKKDSVCLNELLLDIDTLKERVSKVYEDIQSHRDAYCRMPSEEKITEQDIDDIMNKFSLFRDEIHEITNDSHRPIVAKLTKLNGESNRQTDWVRATTRHEDLLTAMRGFSSLDFSRMEREALHKYRVDTGQADSKTIPSHIGSLKTELEALKVWYPALNKVVVTSDKELRIDLLGVVIHLKDDGVRVEGDPLALKPYLSDSGAKDSGPRKRRRRFINSKQDS
jgi:hypothetical protein